MKGIVPHILHTARTCGQTTLREALLQQIAKLSGIVRDNLSTYVPEIIDVVEEFWDSKHLSTVLDLIEKIAAGVPGKFQSFKLQKILYFAWGINCILLLTTTFYSVLYFQLHSVNMFRSLSQDFSQLLMIFILEAGTKAGTSRDINLTGFVYSCKVFAICEKTWLNTYISSYLRY